MNSFVVILLLVAVFFQTSSAFVSGSRAIHLKRGPLAPLKMTTGSAVRSLFFDYLSFCSN